MVRMTLEYSDTLTMQDIEDIIRYQEFQPLCVDTNTIAHIAAKRNFNVEKERNLIVKCKTSKCKYKHYTQSDPCFYRNCRHSPENHYGLRYIGANEVLREKINRKEDAIVI